MRINQIISVFFLFLLVSCSPTTEELYIKAEKFQEQKKYKEAIEVYTKISKRNSKFQDAIFNKGYCYFLDSNYTKALDYYEYLLRKKGVDVKDNGVTIQNVNLLENQEVRDHEVSLGEIFYHIGISKYQIDSLYSSNRYLQLAINEKYEGANCYLWQGLIWIRTGKPDKGCDLFYKSKSLGESDADRLLKAYCQSKIN